MKFFEYILRIENPFGFVLDNPDIQSLNQRGHILDLQRKSNIFNAHSRTYKFANGNANHLASSIEDRAPAVSRIQGG